MKTDLRDFSVRNQSPSLACGTSKILRQRGASLVEVLVAILLVALGILAMAAMQANAARLSKTNEYRAMGSLLASDLADRMRANISAIRGTDGAPTASAYTFQVAYEGKRELEAPGKDCEEVICNSTEMAADDMYDWLKTVKSSLPAGWARVSGYDTTDRGVDVWLMWTETKDAVTASERTACPSDMQTAASANTASPNCMYFRINL